MKLTTSERRYIPRGITSSINRYLAIDKGPFRVHFECPMNRHVGIFCCVIACIVCEFAVTNVRADEPATTQSVATGDIDLTFTERSPLSKPEELARRMNLKESEVSPDYDLSKCPFKAYVPTNYDPSVPVGVFVYLGYKDTIGTPPLWHLVLEKEHLIFISPVCHSGEQYPPAVPKWQSLGLAFDAVQNLIKQYKVNSHRIYMMSWAKDATRVSLAAGDYFTGFIVVGDPGYCVQMRNPDGSFYPPDFPPPPAQLIAHAKEAPFLFTSDGTPDPALTLKIATMKRGGFRSVKVINLTLGEDLHYPNFKAEWLEDEALPFLDKGTGGLKSAKPDVATTLTSTQPSVSQPEHLLSVAKILLSNGQTSLAKLKLQQLVKAYPDDPAADEAKKLLEGLK
jgi:hypothetical protein